MTDAGRGRALLAAGLLLLATAGPLIKWYFAGREAVEREAWRIEALARSREASLASRLAFTTMQRLERVRQEESRRPWFHYQAWFHDPRALADGIALSPSPLVETPGDPLIGAYFVVDDAGVTFLSRRDEAPPLAVSAAALRAAAPECEGAGLTVMDSGSRSAAAQNAQAAVLADQIRKGGLARVASATTVVVEATPLAWRTVSAGASRQLVALRCVLSPSGRIVQGFLVNPNGLDSAVNEVAARLEPATPAATVTRLPLEGTKDDEWAVRVNNAGLTAEAAERAELVRSRFARTFALGATLAILAAITGGLLIMRAHEASRRRAELAAAAAHELRTPLASIRLHAELAEGATDPEAARSHARIVALEAERLGRVVTNVLEFARLETGTLGREPRPTCAADVVRKAVDSQRELLESRGLAIELAIEEGLPETLADADAVAEILCNLLDNSERHSRAVSDRVARVEVRRAAQGGVAVSVIDNGPGIPDSLLTRGPRAFRRGASSSGLGLGLSISTALARAMGGALVLARGAERGCVATLTLPGTAPR